MIIRKVECGLGKQVLEYLGQVRVGLLETDGHFRLLLFAPDNQSRAFYTCLVEGAMHKVRA